MKQKIIIYESSQKELRAMEQIYLYIYLSMYPLIILHFTSVFAKVEVKAKEKN